MVRNVRGTNDPEGAGSYKGGYMHTKRDGKLGQKGLSEKSKVPGDQSIGDQAWKGPIT